jgi:hypothetical protein
MTTTVLQMMASPEFETFEAEVVHVREYVDADLDRGREYAGTNRLYTPMNVRDLARALVHWPSVEECEDATEILFRLKANLDLTRAALTRRKAPRKPPEPLLNQWGTALFTHDLSKLIAAPVEGILWRDLKKPQVIDAFAVVQRKERWRSMAISERVEDRLHNAVADGLTLLGRFTLWESDERGLVVSVEHPDDMLTVKMVIA